MTLEIPLDIARAGCTLCLTLSVEFDPLTGLDCWTVVKCEHQADDPLEGYLERRLTQKHGREWLEHLDAALHDSGFWQHEIEDCLAMEIRHAIEERQRLRRKHDALSIEYGGRKAVAR